MDAFVVNIPFRSWRHDPSPEWAAKDSSEVADMLEAIAARMRWSGMQRLETAAPELRILRYGILFEEEIH